MVKLFEINIFLLVENQISFPNLFQSYTDKMITFDNIPKIHNQCFKY